jgi:transposase
MNDAVVGIDVSKDKLDVFIDSANVAFTVENTADGVASIRERIQGLAVRLIVLEHSGRYERRCAAELLEAGFTVALINPRQARDFARAINWFAKNDRIDTRLLAEFGRRVQPRPTEKLSQTQADLDELVGRRRQLVQMRGTEQVRLLQAEFPHVKSSLKLSIRQLDRQIEKVESLIAKLIDRNDDWRDMVRLLQSVPGVGTTVATTLVAELPELGKINRQEIASLVGLAPFDRESGRWKGKRRCFGGRANIRSLLYMAALTARRCNPIIQRLAQRLTTAGKAYKVIMVACMRKLLTILNVIASSRKPWHYQSTTSS